MLIAPGTIGAIIGIGDWRLHDVGSHGSMNSAGRVRRCNMPD